MVKQEKKKIEDAEAKKMEMHYGDFFYFIKNLHEITISFCNNYIHKHFWTFLTN